MLIFILIIAAAGAGGGYYYTQILAPAGKPQVAGAGPGGPPAGPSAGPSAGMSGRPGGGQGGPPPGMGGGRPGGGPPGMGGMGGGRPVPVNVAKVTKQSFGDRIEAIGTASANESITVTARVQGLVRAISFDDGALVDRGDEIAAIDAGEQDARLNVELANLDEQRKELERIDGLFGSQNVSQARLDQQTSSVKKAEANVAAARARVADYRITAPFPGVLGTRRVSVGALVSPGTVMTTLDDISIIKLDFAVPETFLASLKPGLDIEATSAAYEGQIFKGQVVAVDSRVDPVTRSVGIRAAIPNPDKLLRPGMLMVADLIKDRRESLVIPEHALVPEGPNHFVFVVGADSTAERIGISIGPRQLGAVEVLEGLNEGDVIVVEGNMDLRPKAKLEILNQDKMSMPPSAENRPGRSPS
ncbi:MAG: efflux RND transporter periplasmic adaptor subunit [Alphaproteobacteria bacterium]|nr:efflux RND transporter periplasmic adaptor subunit [Alphaproteobacteria bacterium]